MSNTVEFILKLKDLMSGTMQRVASTTQSAFNTVDRTVGRTTRNITDLNTRLDQLRKTRDLSVDTRQIRNVNREIDRLERRMTRMQNLGLNRGGGMGLGGMLAGIGGIAGIGMGIGSAIGASARQEQQLVGLRTFLGEQNANAAFADIKKDSARTPYSLDALMEVNRSLISAGVNFKDARKDAMNLANAVAAVGGGNDVLSRMAANMQQIKTLGKATAMDVRQFGMAGINIYKMLSDATGKSIKQVQEMDVSYELLSFALAKAGAAGGIYAGALEAQSQTIIGKWSTFKDNITLQLATMGDAMRPMITKLLDWGTAFAQNTLPKIAESIGELVTNYGVPFVTWLKDVAVWIRDNSTWIGFLVTTIGSAILVVKTITLATKLWAGAQALLNIVMSANPIGVIIVAVAALVAGIIYAYNRFEWFRGGVTALWESMNAFGNLIKDVVIDRLKTLLSGITGIGRALYQLFTGEFKQAFTTGAQAVMDLTGVSTAAKAYEGAKKVGDAWRKGYANGASKIAGIPGASSAAAAAAMPSAGTTSGAGAFSSLDTDKKINGGGVRNITINLGKLFDDINITTQTINEGVDRLEERVVEALSRVLYSGGALQDK